MSGYGIHGGDGMKKYLRTHLKVFHMEYTGKCKDLDFSAIFWVFLDRLPDLKMHLGF